MSTAHRPTWNPAVGKEARRYLLLSLCAAHIVWTVRSRAGSRQFSTRDVASHTKLKFRQPGQGGSNEIEKRDLKAQLLKAEEEARAKKRKAAGLPQDEDTSMAEIEDRNPEELKRRKLLQDIALDKDDDDDEEEADKSTGQDTKMSLKDDSDDDDDDDDEEEDETAELLRELEKIKRERAEEQARKDREANAANESIREAEIATANPLMNLQAALGQGASTSSAGSFAVKKRWDDDLIFKNQANGQSDKPSGQFVNDLLRTEFHKKFMQKFIK